MEASVTINKERYPCRMTMGAMLLFKRLSGKEMSEMSDGALSEVAILIYSCVKSASEADGIKMDLGLEEFCNRIDVDQMLSLQKSLTAGGGAEEKREKNGGAD